MIKSLLMLLILCVLSSKSMAEITIAMSPQCPYLCNESAPASGYIPQIITEALFPEKVNFIKIPQGRLKEGLRKGNYDFIIS